MSDRRTPESDAEEDFAVNFGKDCIVVHVDCSRRLEQERNEAQERVKELTHENESLYRRLESVHEVYRLSSVCRELKAENEQLKQQQP
jgi:predicted nuclease with TOPRIM domain